MTILIGRHAPAEPTSDTDAGEPRTDLPAGFDDPDSPFYVPDDLRPYYPTDRDFLTAVMRPSFDWNRWYADDLALRRYAELLADGTLHRLAAARAAQRPDRHAANPLPAITADTAPQDQVRILGTLMPARRMPAMPGERIGPAWAEGLPDYRSPADAPADLRDRFVHAAALAVAGRERRAVDDAIAAERKADAERAAAEQQWVVEHTCALCGLTHETVTMGQVTQGRALRAHPDCLAVIREQHLAHYAGYTLADGTTIGARAAAWLATSPTGG